jgi:DNA replication and repair protein RecF
VLARSLTLTNFRNHRLTTIGGFASGINVIAGPNGAGKTSILEALSVAALSKSFTGVPDASLVTTGGSSYSVHCGFESSLRVGLHVIVDYTLGPPAKKIIYLNNDKLRSSSQLVGDIPIVALTPDDKVITSGSPDERRRFLNLVLSQSSKKYLEDEIEYRKALRQRNSLLSDAVKRGVSFVALKDKLTPWTEMLIKFAVPIMKRRAEFIHEFRPFLLESYRKLSEGKEEPSFRYAPMNNSEWDGNTDFDTMLRSRFKEREAEEYRRGNTLVGPHRDDMLIMIDPERTARDYASQGQHKTLLVSLKLAEFFYLREATRETPILLLDDVFSELDATRAKTLLALIASGEFGQTFISSTTRESFTGMIDFSGDKNMMFVVDSGIVQ